MRTTVLVATALLASCAKTPPSEPPREIAPAPVDASAGKPLPPLTSTPSPSSSAGGASTTGARCATHADCRTYSSYCGEAPCTCFVLAKSEHDKKCARPGVSCFVDPCMKKHARCEGGACRLADE
jgi:hypothetical protein